MFFLLLLIAGLTVYAAPVDSIGVETRNGNRYVRHKVETGETWFALSRNYGVPYAEIRAANKGAADALKVGQIVLIPSKGNAPVPVTRKSDAAPKQEVKPAVKDIPPASVPAQAASGQKHKVASGETLYSISRKYGISPDDLRKWNKIEGNAIKVGQELTVGTGPAASTYNPPVSKPAEPLKKTGESIVPEVTEPARETKPLTEDRLPEVEKKAPVPPVAKEEKVSESGSRYVFANGRKEITEQGVAAWIDDEEINPDKYYALHRTAPIGTIIKVTNRMNGRHVFVKVIGKLPDAGDNEGLIIKLSKAGAQQTGAVDQRFQVELLYGVSEK